MASEIIARYHVRRREFLNQNPTSGEFIIGVVQDTREISDDDEQTWKWGAIQLELADGYRWVSFDFDMSDRAERGNSLRKINLIAEVINEVRKAIELEVESRNARPHVLYLGEAAIA
jgi:hypothetical protein